MCDTRGHEHWCSNCGKDLNKESKDSYIEIEWSQNEKGQIVEEKSMICDSCLEESDNIKELDKFFSELKYHPWGHVFCSSCHRDITKEYEDKEKEETEEKTEKKGIVKKIGDKLKSKGESEFDKGPKPGIDYECLYFKCHERYGKPGSRIKHIIKVVVLCPDCMKKEFNLENVERLKKLGRNPIFKPTIGCPNTEKCGQFKKGDENINCKQIVIGRDRETLQFGLLCGRKHKGALVLPFDDGISITRPRKKKGAALANPQSTGFIPAVPMSSSLPFDVNQYAKVMKKVMKDLGFGKDGKHIKDIENTMKEFDRRLEIIEKAVLEKSPIIKEMDE